MFFAKNRGSAFINSKIHPELTTPQISRLLQPRPFHPALQVHRYESRFVSLELCSRDYLYRAGNGSDPVPQEDAAPRPSLQFSSASKCPPAPSSLTQHTHLHLLFYFLCMWHLSLPSPTIFTHIFSQNTRTSLTNSSIPSTN